ncbi:17370_t:CDS:2, partial [Dentiscutata heterogama]
LGSKEDFNFASKLSSKIDNILEVSLDSCDNKMSYKVKYKELYIFSMSEEGNNTHKEENSDSDKSEKGNIYYKMVDIIKVLDMIKKTTDMMKAIDIIK